MQFSATAGLITLFAFTTSVSAQTKFGCTLSKYTKNCCFKDQPTCVDQVRLAPEALPPSMCDSKFQLMCASTTKEFCKSDCCDPTTNKGIGCPR